MKIIFFLVCLGLLSVALFARDLSSAARRERERRAALPQEVRRNFTDEDLNVYARFRVPDNSQRRTTSSAPLADSRDAARKRAHWKAQKEKLDRELSRLDAQIKRLEWRLTERRARNRRQAGKRLDEQDTTARLLEDSLEGLRTARRHLEEAFRERARKAGALPGWLR